MADFKEKAMDIAGNAGDIARDKLDSFRKLSREQQILIIVFAGIIVSALVVWMLMPGKLDVTITRIVMDGVMDNQVVIQNNGDEPLGKLKVILNDMYEYEVPQMVEDETVSISVGSFKRRGNPDGPSPDPHMIPKKVEVIGKGARLEMEFQ